MHHTQRERRERIRVIKAWLQEALDKSSDTWITRNMRRGVVNQAMVHFGCSERRAKEYVKIARIELEASQ